MPNQAQDPNKPIVSAVTPILTEPKAIREPYSLEALNRSNSKPIVANTSIEPKTNDIKTTDTNLPDDESISWAWPTQGKISARFNEGSNKGIDIAGTMGQAINAASTGK
jgi:lipoprotein NlpD